MKCWQTVTVGVASMTEALALWRERFGLEIVATRAAGDADLARLWQLAPSEIGEQMLLATPGQSSGRLHLVEFPEPSPPVREGAASFDLAPKNLDIYVDDLPARERELRRDGFTFRAERHSEVTAPDGTVFRELHLPAHDAINVVLLQIVGAGKPVTSAGFGAVGPLIVTVPDAAAEQRFSHDVLALEKLSDHRLDGPEIEAMIGLPAGAALDVSIWGSADAPFGQLEIIEYGGTDGRNLYPRAVAPATGILQVRFHDDATEALVERLGRAGVEWQAFDDVDLIDGRGRVLRFRSPAGLVIEVLSRA